MTEGSRPPTSEQFRPPSFGSTSLVIIGHGSHLSPRSAEPAYAHADALRDQNTFTEVREAFWKEEPSPREVLRTVETDAVVVVPLFMAEGYFTEQVIPRELRVADEWDLDVDKQVRYAEPVGTHEAMTEVVVERAERITDDRDIGEGFGLAVVGHGTERNENSAKAARDHAARIRDRGRFDEVRALFMDESPAIEDLTDYFETEDVVVVPLFVADGYHTQEDIPEDVGLTDDYRDSYDVPAAVDGHRIWYAGAVGTESLLADVILERARDAVADDNYSNADPNDTDAAGATPHRAFLQWVEKGLGEGETRTWGELQITATIDADGERRYELRHEDDRDTDFADLETCDLPRDLRDLARFYAEGDFRPLGTAPTLPNGWQLPDLDSAELVRAIEFVYPATITNWHLEREGDLDVTHFRATADRQTGIYERTAELDRLAVENAAVACCSDETCLKRREWDYDEDQLLDAPRGDGEFPCREPCSLFVAAAREFAAVEREGKGDNEDESHLGAVADGRTDEVRDGGVRDGDVSDPANRFRMRYRRARRSGDETTCVPEECEAVAEGGR